MAVPKTKLTMWSQYLAARVGEMLLTMWPVEANFRTFAAIGRYINAFDKRHRLRAQHNLEMAIPEIGPEERARLVEQSYEHLLKLIVEVTYSSRVLSLDSWGKYTHLELDELRPAIKLLNSGKPIIMLTGHVGNWEALGVLLGMLGYRMEALARPLDNPLLNDWVTRIREKRGLKVIVKWDATDRMIDVLSGGGALGFIADQNAGDRGLFVPFFGKLASTYKSIALLAMSQNVPIVCGYAQRIGGPFEYRVGSTDLIMPEDWADQPDPVYYITARYMRAIEMMIRKAPDQYLWVHRRWKSRPKHERQGKPMPAALQRKLESLPWMTDDLLKSVSEPMPPYVDV